MQLSIQAVGIPWFEEDDYETFRLLLPDRHWHATFAKWESAAQQHLKCLHHQGIRTVKAKVRSAAFADWCRATGRNIDAEALRYFANTAAYRMLRGEH